MLSHAYHADNVEGKQQTPLQAYHHQLYREDTHQMKYGGCSWMTNA